MSVASQSLMDNVTDEDLDKRWEGGNWSAYDIDFSKDKKGGRASARSSAARRCGSTRCSSTARTASPTTSPHITAAPSEEQSDFLATQQVDEVRHSVFFHRFFKEVIGVGGDSTRQTRSSTLPELNWGYRGIFDRLDEMAEELRKDRSLPKYAQAITLYHLIVEGFAGPALPSTSSRTFSPRDTMPGFSEGMANVFRDEQRHIGFGVKVLSELLAKGTPPRRSTAPR